MCYCNFADKKLIRTKFYSFYAFPSSHRVRPGKALCQLMGRMMIKKYETPSEIEWMTRECFIGTDAFSVGLFKAIHSDVNRILATLLANKSQPFSAKIKFKIFVHMLNVVMLFKQIVTHHIIYANTKCCHTNK